jgi:hypothetical protein
LRFDQQLLGEWKLKPGSGDEESWKFEPGDGKTYKLTITEKGPKKGQFEARLFQLKETQFLDLVPTEWKSAEDQAGMVESAIFPGHLLVRVSISGSELTLTFFDFDWLGKHLEEHPKSLAYHVEQKRPILTAETADLQRFVLEHLNELFKEPATLVRSKPDDSGAAKEDRK